MLTQEQAREFAGRWLPAWSGNRPEHLARFYSEDVFYSDPGIPQGVHGRAMLTVYFRKLLAQNPNWVWTQVEGIPMEGGFLNKWNGRTLQTLFEYIHTQMPLDNPGQLNEQQVADALAQMLLVSGAPAGDTELSADSSALAGITITPPAE